MNYIFFDTKWKLYDGELPVKEHFKTKDGEFPWRLHEDDLQRYNQAIADIKSKALEIDNPEIIDNLVVGLVVGKEFHEWPGSYEKKIIFSGGWVPSYNDPDNSGGHPMSEPIGEVAHLVLPPEAEPKKILISELDEEDRKAIIDHYEERSKQFKLISKAEPPEEKNMKTDNELIAEFMGFKFAFERGHRIYYVPPGEDLKYKAFKLAHVKFAYDTSWDWLMPVVEKIGKIELNNGQYSKFVDFSITTNDGIGWIFWTKGIPGDQNQPQSYSIEGTMIQRVYKAVVEFIKWYNHRTP